MLYSAGSNPAAATNMQFKYVSVPGLGTVILSRHALAQASDLHITEVEIRRTLFHGQDRPDGQEIIWRENGNVRLVILLSPSPDRGAKLVKTLYRIREQEKGKK